MAGKAIAHLAGSPLNWTPKLEHWRLSIKLFDIAITVWFIVNSFDSVVVCFVVNHLDSITSRFIYIRRTSVTFQFVLNSLDSVVAYFNPRNLGSVTVRLVVDNLDLAAV
ncbi:hypothetical protein H2200_013029 [Cladophialophora chaetospira]|uniref:Uncharacterized protein n=1 Tax=Cladophialophora chaetospira TaxID=386627 RepID=A0AA38WWL5_9EURO|nr:hypothetical protein H2200_013029 [Cladophialophora chaetospira]